MASYIAPAELAYELAHYEDDRAPAIIGGSVALIAVASIAVVLRLLARKMKTRNSKKLQWAMDDYMIVAALVGEAPVAEITQKLADHLS